MKRNIMAIIIVMVIILLPLNLFADSTNLGQSKDKIRIAGDKNYPPYEYLDENGQYKGFNVDIMRAISIELGLDIEIIPMTWNEALVALQKGEVDAIQGMTKSNIREEKFSFTNQLVTNSQVIFVRKDTSYITGVDDLSGVKVAFQKGDVNQEIIEKTPDIIPFVKENQFLAIEALLNGEVDAFVGNRLTGLYYLQKIKRLEEIKIVGDPMYVTEYCSATLKDNHDILNTLNKGIREIKQNGTYDKIYKKWFGESFEDNSIFWKRLLFFSLIILFLTLAIITIVFYLNRKLKEEVRSRTEQIEIQKKNLDKSNRLRGKILEGIDNGIIAFDRDGKVLGVNNSAKSLLNKDINTASSWEEVGLSEYIDKSEFKYVLENNVWKNNIILIKNDGSKRYIECRMLPIKAPDNVEGAILVLYDYTKEKHLQDIINHNDKMQAIGKLAAGIAHELRNPLTSIKGFIDLLPYKFEDSTFRENFVNITNSEIQRLNNLVSLLLDYAKPKAAELKRVRLDKIVKDTLMLFSAKTRKDNIKIINNISDVEIMVDALQIKQVLINIILNSMEAIKDSGIITISDKKIGNKVAIEITDNGCGIPEDMIDKVFNPFFTMKKSGYGIGLAICHQLVKENGGEIVVYSKVGEGTTMTILLNTANEEGEKIHAQSFSN